MKNMTEEQKILLQKFGFDVTQTQIVHKKTGVTREIDAILQLHTLAELEEYIKALLRNQCKYGR